MKKSSVFLVVLVVLAIAWSSYSARSKQKFASKLPIALRRLVAQETKNDLERSPYCFSFFCRFPNRCCPGYVCRFNAFQPYFKGVCVRQVNFHDVLGLGDDSDKIDDKFTPLLFSTNATGNATTTARPSNTTAVTVTTTTIATTTRPPNCTATTATTLATTKPPFNATASSSPAPYMTASTTVPRVNVPNNTSFSTTDSTVSDEPRSAGPSILKTLTLATEKPLASSTTVLASSTTGVPLDSPQKDALI